VPPAWLALVVFGCAIGLHATGLLGSLLYPGITAGAVICAVVGLRRFRPNGWWPWSLLMVTGMLWTAAGLMRASTGATGDLSTSRSLWPDVFAFPGYLLFGCFVVVMVRSRTVEGDRGVLIDAFLVAAGSAAVVFSVVIAPILEIERSWVLARIAVAIYPSISMFLLIGALQLAFRNRRNPEGYVLVLGGVGCLVIGDVVFALGEVGALRLSGNVLDVPYLLVGALLSAATLHPSVHAVPPARDTTRSTYTFSRLVAVAFGLVAPLIAVVVPAGGISRLVQIALCLVVGSLVVTRISTASKSEDAARNELYHRATHDSLTGLPSRMLVVDGVAHLVDQDRPLPIAVMCLDLDEFKLINDSLGHAAGDQLLVLVAARLVGAVRPGDIVGRISGDEFVVVAAGLDGDGARALADRIRQQLRRPFQLSTGEVFASGSIGITVATGDADPETLMQEADTAMYRSKETGRNRTTVFDSSMRDRVARRIDMEQGLRHALNNDEVGVVFQPIVNVTTGRIEGFEALMRWATGDRSYSPADFIDIAEQSGLIVPLGAYVLDEACGQLAHWRRTIPSERDLYVSVNISPRQVQLSNIVDTVDEALRRNDLPASALWLEITESVTLDDTVTTTAVMNGLRGLGVQLAIDDFGTGYSSLSYLRRFPISRVKIDRSFVADLGDDADAHSLVAAVMSVSHIIGLDVVAEGVETIEQQRRLVDLGCSKMQGYLYSQGVPASEVPATLRHINRATVDPSWRVSPRRDRSCIR